MSELEQLKAANSQQEKRILELQLKIAKDDKRIAMQQKMIGDLQRIIDTLNRKLETERENNSLKKMVFRDE